MNFNEMRKEAESKTEQKSNSEIQLIEQQSQTIAELQQTISQLILGEETQKQAILKLNEENERLLELSKNERALTQKYTQLQNTLNRQNKDHKAEVMTWKDKVKNVSESLEKEKNRPPEVVYQYKKVPYEKCENCNKTAMQQAKEDYESKSAGAKKKYETITQSYKGFLLGVLLYSLMITLFTAIRSERLVDDFKTFFITLWHFITFSVSKVLQFGKFVAKLGDMIPQHTVAVIVHWLLIILVVGAITIGIGVILFLGASIVITYYSFDFKDNITVAVSLISLAIVVFFGNEIRAFLPVNLFLLLLIIQAVYIGVRVYIEVPRGY